MKLLSSVLCAVMLAGISYATAESKSSIPKNVGDIQVFSVFTLLHEVTSCHLKTPAGVTLDFIHGEAHPHGDRYELQPLFEAMPGCSITVKNLQESDTGDWELSFVSPTTATVSQSYHLIVTGSGDSDIQDSEENEDNVNMLSVIEFPTRTGQIIDISLAKTDHEERCSVRSPSGDNIKVSELNIEFVTHHESSNFVSCRITIGPMTESLIGDWAVCGTYTENNKQNERCQPAKIFWNIEDQPDHIWSTLIEPSFDHPVHLGKTITPVVIGIGNIVSCHVITPNEEDLVIKEDSKYPGIKADTLVHSTCGIAIGPIYASSIGSWTVYGVFRDTFHVLNEIRLPLKMFLYDEENPYNQAYNVTVHNPMNRVVRLGNTINVEVNVNAGQLDKCYFVAPSGQIYNMDNHNTLPGTSFANEEIENSIVCGLVIGPITKELLGDWKLIGKFSNNGVFTEQQQTIHVILEDPENPIEEDRTIIDLKSQNIAAEMGDIHRLIIHTDAFIHAESCHIRTPDGLQFKIMEGFSMPGIKVIEDVGVECGIIVNVISESMIGEWILIARATMFSDAIERRLPFTINVEESVEALPTNITITEGNDIVVRLKHPTNAYETCKLIGPYGRECAEAERDPINVETCGFIRKNAQTFHSGIWTITYGDRIVHKAEIYVIVIPESTESAPTVTSLDLLRDRSVNKVVGLENAVYCRLEDPSGFAVFDGFGRCNLTLDKVGLEHHGAWNMIVGVPGKVLTEKYQLNVNVRESEGKAIVTTHVEKQRPLVIITCAVETKAEVKACKFRDANGKILLVADGVSEDRYTFYGNEVSYNSKLKTHECGIRISNPLTSDLGLWRCAIETSEDTYYGHMPVLCPFALLDPAVAAAVQQEPLLTSDRSHISVVEEQPTTMSCSVQSAIRYCYFRASNGTTFTVTPSMSSSEMEYSGAGFDAGECGIRLRGMRASDSGRWSCHVGLVQPWELTEQRATFEVAVHERMTVNHYRNHRNVMVVEGIVYERRALEYCRFVRIDGFGFTTDSVPSEYTVTGLLANGECQFTARNPTILDLHPWTVVARIRGQDVEIAKDTMEAILISPPTTTEPPPETIIIYRTHGLMIFMYVFLSLLLMTIVMGAWLGPKKNREWTYRHASSLRRSFQRKPQQQSMPEAPPAYNNA